MVSLHQASPVLVALFFLLLFHWENLEATGEIFPNPFACGGSSGARSVANEGLKSTEVTERSVTATLHFLIVLETSSHILFSCTEKDGSSHDNNPRDKN